MFHPRSLRQGLTQAGAAGVVAIALAYASLSAQVAPNLGAAAQFAVLGNSGVTGSTGVGTAVNGDVGSSPTASVTNFPPSSVTPPFTLHLTNDATVQQARTDTNAAYTFLVAQGPGTVLPAQLNGQVLAAGVYSFTGGAADLAASGTLTLNGPGIFIFQVDSTLTANVLSNVAGTADPCNVYWRVGTSATLNGATFRGTVIADASITVGDGANVTGRVLAGAGLTGAVTMAGAGGNTIGGCSAQTPPTISKAFNPTSIVAGSTSQLTITLNNPNSSTITLTAVFTDTLPAGVLVAPTPGVSTTCGGTATATAGGTTVSLASGSTMPASGSCTISVNVTAAAVGSYVNTIPIGALQTTAGNNAAPASATLTVIAATVAPTLSKAFNAESITAGGTSVLTITLNNANSAAISLTADFTDTLPTGVLVAPTPAVSTTCGGTASATAGGSTVSLASGSTVPAGSCTISVSVTGAAAGSYVNTIAAGALQTSAGNNAASASATLTVTALPPGCPVITITPATLASGLVGQPYSQTLTASGGTAPYTFTVSAGTLPPGLALSTAGGPGLLSGTPTTNGSSTFTIRATDANNCPADMSYVMTVTTSVPTMPEYFLMLLALMLATVGYFHLRR